MAKLLLSKLASAATTQLNSHFRITLESSRLNNALCTYTLAPKSPVPNELYNFPSDIMSTPSSKRFYSSSSSSDDNNSTEDKLRTLSLKQKLQAVGVESKGSSRSSKVDDPFHSKSVPVLPNITKEDALREKTRSEGQLGEGASQEPLTTPACASLNQITPLDEHTIGFDLSRRRHWRQASEADTFIPTVNPPPLSITQKPSRDADADLPILIPTSPKMNPKKRMKNRMPVLNQNDCFRRHLFALKLLLILEDEPDILDHILWTDECNFVLPKIGSLIRKPAVSESGSLPQIAWCGISSMGAIGPYFFNSYATDKSYLRMLESYVLPELESKGYNLKELWFQQDGAPWHRTQPVLDFLRSVFDHRVISLGTPFVWPPHSQDLTPMDYFFWEYMKIRLNFKHSKYDLAFQQEFREILTREVASSNLDAVQEAIYQLPIRLALCVSANGERFSHLLYPDEKLETSDVTNTTAGQSVSQGLSRLQEIQENSQENEEVGEESQTMTTSPQPHQPHPGQTPSELIKAKLTEHYSKIPNKADVTLDKSDPVTVPVPHTSTGSHKKDNNDGQNKGA